MLSLLITLLTLPLLAIAIPQVTFWSIHLASFVILLAYIFGLRLISSARETPMWSPRRTKETSLDEAENDRFFVTGLWMRLGFYALTIAVAGYAVAQSGVAIAEKTGISESVVGNLFS